MARQWFSVRCESRKDPSVYDFTIFDVIGRAFDGVDAADFVGVLKELPPSVKTIRLSVNSPGGDLFDAISISNALREHPARVEATILGLAASAATVITSGGCDHIKIADNALLMIHEPWAATVGSAGELRKAAELLDASQAAVLGAYRRRSKLSDEQLLAMMAAETWMDARTAVENGFADEVLSLGASSDVEDLPVEPAALNALRSTAAPYASRIAAFNRRTTAALPAAEVVSLCAAAQLGMEFTGELVKLNLPKAAVVDRIAREVNARAVEAERVQAVSGVCKLAGLPQLADGYVKAGTPVAYVREHLTTITALLDAAGGNIDTTLDPDGMTEYKRARGQGRIDATDIYAERNGFKKGGKD